MEKFKLLLVFVSLFLGNSIFSQESTTQLLPNGDNTTKMLTTTANVVPISDTDINITEMDTYVYTQNEASVSVPKGLGGLEGELSYMDITTSGFGDEEPAFSITNTDGTEVAWATIEDNRVRVLLPFDIVDAESIFTRITLKITAESANNIATSTFTVFVIDVPEDKLRLTMEGQEFFSVDNVIDIDAGETYTKDFTPLFSNPITAVETLRTLPHLVTHTISGSTVSITSSSLGTDYIVYSVTDGDTTLSSDLVIYYNVVAVPIMFSMVTIEETYKMGTEITELTLPAATGGNGGPLHYALTPVLSAGLSFNNATRTITGTPTEIAETTEYTLTATDTDSDTDTLTFSITVIPANLPPTSSIEPIDPSLLFTTAGDTGVGGGVSITLRGSGTDPDGDDVALTYAWTQIGGTKVALSGANTATASFITPARTNMNQQLVFEFIVTDPEGLSSTVTGLFKRYIDLVVFPLRIDLPPTANAGTDQTVDEGSNVILNGSGTDPEGEPLEGEGYAWSQTSGTGVDLIDADTASPSFTAPSGADTVLEFSLTVTDAMQGTGADTVTITVKANIEITDSNFEQALIDLKIDTNGKNGNILSSDAAKVTFLDIRWKEISDLTGIEGFTSLTVLICNGNQLTSLDVSQNTALTALGCAHNQLTSLNVSQNTALTALGCAHNQLTSLDVSKNTALAVFIGNNNKLTSLNVSQNTALKFLYCNNNELTSLDVSANTSLISLNCNNNQLLELNVSANTALKTLYCSYNQLTSLDVSNNRKLTRLVCHSNVKRVNSSGVAAKLLTDLDVSQNTALTFLACFGNNLTSLDVSQNTALTYLDCRRNLLTTLEVSANTALTYLSCRSNLLTSLDVSANTNLVYLNLNYNELEELDVSNNSKLTSLRCKVNQLTSLNIANGNNSNFIFFKSVNNPNLTCIQVDDEEGSRSRWYKDAVAAYRVNCSTTNMPKSKQGKTISDFNENKDSELADFLVSPNPARGILNIRVVEKADYRLVNIRGQILKKGALATGENRLDISSLARGIYFLNLKNSKGSFIEKIIKE